MEIKKKIVGVGLLAVISLIVALSSLNTEKEVKNENKNNIDLTNKIISTEENIVEEEEFPNELDEQQQIIWIKNLTFLTDNSETYDTIMTLKTKLNTELKTLNDEIYEVNLIEDTYKKTESGFEIEARADKLEGSIFIEHCNSEFIFTIIEN